MTPLASVLLLATVARPGLFGPPVSSMPYLVPQLPWCMPQYGTSMVWRLYATPHDDHASTAQPPATPPAVTNPQAVFDLLDLARCEYMLGRDDITRPALNDVERLLQRTIDVLHADAGAEAAANTNEVDSDGHPLVRVGGSIPPPRAIMLVPPAPPSDAAGMSGIVFIDAVIDETGIVRDTRVVGSIPPLDHAAEDAVRHSTYAPTVVNGQPVRVIDLVAVKFGSGGTPATDGIDLARFLAARARYHEAADTLDDALAAVRAEPREPKYPLGSVVPAGQFGAGAHVFGPGIVMPVPVTQVPAKYTRAALDAKITGTAVVECVVGTDGRVHDARIAQSLDSQLGLDNAALAAARQWVFKSAKDKDGTPISTLIKIQLAFGITAQGPSPRVVRHVDPVYPPEARAAGVEGLVVIVGTLSPNGDLGNLAVVHSTPALDRAALDAVRHWRFELRNADTTPQWPIVFTVIFQGP